MRLEQSFEVPVSVATAWEVLLDLEKIAPCMPGATLTGFNGTDFTGLVKVKLGPVSLSYKGNGRFVERDEAGRRVAFIASGQDSRGAGGASARVTAVLHENDAGATTVVKVVADLDIAGKAAQFGRGMIADVTGKLVRQFAECLATTIAAAPPAAAAAAVAPAPVAPLPPVTMPPPSPDLAPPPAPTPAPVAASTPVAAPSPVAAPPIAPASEYHPLAMQEPAAAPATPAGPAVEPPAPAPTPPPQVEALPEVKAASEYAYDPAPPVPSASGSGAGVSSSGEAPMTLSRPPVEGAPIDLIAVSGAKRRLLVPGLVVIAVVVIAVVVILALG